MAKKYIPAIPCLEPTPREVFFSRRKFMASMGLGIAAVSSQACTSSPFSISVFSSGPEIGPEEMLQPPISRPGTFPAKRNAAYELPSSIGHELTPREVAGSHNNFYEFLPGRGGPVWKHAGDFVVDPWKIEIKGECNNRMTLDLDDLFKFEHEERLYHFRCVERWAMNVPWSGFPLSKLIEKADPKPSAKYLRFTTAYVPKSMPGARQSPYYPWPYVEALRLDEAMNELAMVVTGAYGEPLLKQHGAPARIIVPWKYGYKNPKSIVKIEFVKRQPKIFWQIQPHEYGFLSNVNPFIPHPRWSQAQSRWLGSDEPFSTPIFNGYERYVADLYPDEPRTLQTPLRQGQEAR